MDTGSMAGNGHTVADDPGAHAACGTLAVEATVSEWQKVCVLESIPQLGARVVKSAHGNIAVFRTAGDEVFAMLDKCPHKGGPLSQGIVFGRKVACPLHGWNINVDDGSAVAPDKGCTRTFPVRIEDGVVFLDLAQAGLR